MNLAQVQKSIHDNPGLLLYFWGENCNVCHALRPKLFEAFESRFPKIERVAVNVTEHPDIAAHFGVFSIPTGIVFLDGREFERFSRNLSIPALIQKLERPYSLFFD